VYSVSIDGALPQPARVATSPWGGLSGAGMICETLLTGVVAAAPIGWGHSRLEAVPAYVLHHDSSFRRVLAEHGGQVGLEPVEWQKLTMAQPKPVASPAALLEARRAVVPFRGRENLLAQIEEWASAPGFGARLIFGPEGRARPA